MIASACSSWAHRNAAFTSLDRYDEPRSTQVYLSTSPRKNSVRLVPFSWTISARSTSAGSFTSSAPPSPQCTFFVSWKERQPSAPTDPSGRPRWRAITPWAASSISVSPCSEAIAARASSSQPTPA